MVQRKSCNLRFSRVALRNMCALFGLLIVICLWDCDGTGLKHGCLVNMRYIAELRIL